jgi:hypothetical protein
MGSGKILRYAIHKHGIENFTKEILFQFDDEADMNAKETELVTEEFCLREDTYNLCVGGKGGFGYINQNGLSPVNNGSESHRERMRKAALNTNQKLKKRFKDDQEFYDNWRKSLQGRLPTIGTTGKRFSEETKDKMSKSKIGNKNSQFGTFWITDGFENKKLKKDQPIPKGWYKGRK